MKPIAHVGHPHLCPLHGPGVVAIPGQFHVRYNGIPLAVEGGICTCLAGPCPDPMVSGSAAVRINGRGVMRIGDKTLHKGRIVMGVPGLRCNK